MVSKYIVSENIEFSIIVKDARLTTNFNWGDVRMTTPWHQKWYNCVITAYDKESNWKSRIRLFIPCADWISHDEVRDYVYELMKKKGVEFPEKINGDKKTTEKFHESIRKINHEIRDFYSLANYKDNF